MSLGAVVNGVLYNRAISISVSRDIRNFVGWFEIVSSPSRFNRIPIKVGDKVEIVAGTNTVIMTAFIEKIAIRYSASNHEIVASGRDVTCDLVDSTLKTKQYRGPLRFDGFINSVLSEQGASFPVFVEVDQVGEVGKDEVISGETGEPVMEFLERYARRVGLVLTSSPEGGVTILRTGKTSASDVLTNIPGGPDNNVISCGVDINDSHLYGEYSVTGQLSPAAGTVTDPTDVITDQSASTVDSRVRRSRFLQFEAEAVMDQSALQDRADLESNLRQARGLRYSALVRDIRTDMQINRLIQVRDDICGISGRFLISKVDYNFDLSKGSTTEVEVTQANAYSLDAELDQISEARTGQAGDFQA